MIMSKITIFKLSKVAENEPFVWNKMKSVLQCINCESLTGLKFTPAVALKYA